MKIAMSDQNLVDGGLRLKTALLIFSVLVAVSAHGDSNCRKKASVIASTYTIGHRAMPGNVILFKENEPVLGSSISRGLAQHLGYDSGNWSSFTGYQMERIIISDSGRVTVVIKTWDDQHLFVTRQEVIFDSIDDFNKNVGNKHVLYLIRATDTIKAGDGIIKMLEGLEEAYPLIPGGRPVVG